jgi:hypothetical protein
MKRFFFMAALFFLGAGTASADYLLIKININQLNFVPNLSAPNQGGGPGAGGPTGGPQQPPPGGIGGGGAQPFPGPGGPGQPPPPPGNVVPEDPNAKWVWAFVEIKNYNSHKPILVNPFGFVFAYEHKWSKSSWLTRSPLFPVYGGYFDHPSFTQEFDAKFNKEKKQKDKSTKNLLELARWTLKRGQIKEFHKVMSEAEKSEPKNPIVKKYLDVKKELDAPFKSEDPAQADLIATWRKEGYKAFDSERKHYRLFAQAKEKDLNTSAMAKRRLALMEDTLDSFYYWFAMQEGSTRRPKLPKYRLNALLAGSKDDFTVKHAQWGQMPMAADGFTPRRDNVIVMSPRPRLLDPLYNEFESVLTNKIEEANQKLQKMNINLTITREDLLNGNLSDTKKNPAASNAVIYIGLAQTAVLLSKTFEDEAERHTVTNEAVRELLIASEMFPRNVQIPDWMAEGLAALFETPASALFPAIGEPSWTHLVSFKYFQKKNRFANPSDVLHSVVTDAYFMDARLLSKDAEERTDNADLQKAAKEAWELARCTAWAFVYSLAQDNNLDYLFKYGDELNKLPRDMDLNDSVLRRCFAKAFDCEIDGSKMKKMASDWFEMMPGKNLELVKVQAYYEVQRAKRDAPTEVAVSPPMPPDPGTNPPPVNPQPANLDPASLVGTSWGGHETLPGYGPLTFRFEADGKAAMTDKDGNTQGTYTQKGNNIVVQFPSLATTYTGTVQGKSMLGTATNGQTNWNWNVNSGAAPNQALNPGGGPRRNPGGVRPPSPGNPRPKGPRG